MKKTPQQAKAFRDACIKNGYLPVPIWNVNEVDSKGKIKNGKEPVAFDWVKIAKAGKLPASSPKQTNTGIALTDIYAIDVDVEDEAIAQEIEKLIEVHLGTIKLKRVRSNSHRFLTLFRSEGGIKKQYVSEKSGDGKVEILSDGQQFVADGWHYSGVEIEWENEISPANFPKADLPLVSQDMMKAFLFYVKHLFDADKFTIHGFNETKQRTSSNQNNAFDNSSTHENEPIELEDLKDWLLHLNKKDDYDSWVEIIGAIYNATDGSNEGFDLADEWSKKSDKYDADSFAKKWLSFATSPMQQLNGHFILKKLRKQTPKYHSPSIQKSKKTFSDNFKVRDGKLYFVLKSDEGDEYKYVSDAFDYIGKCRDTKGMGWAHLIEWKDETGIRHQEKVPFREMGTEQTEIFQRLRDSGLMCGTTKDAQNLFKKFLSEQDTSQVIETTKKSGWFRNSSLIQDGTKIGDANIALDITCEPSNAGNLEDWKTQVAKYASGNKHIMFSICAALAGPLLDVANIPGGGFHLFGKSQMGKTSALAIAASVIGGPQAIRSWRATDNGLESVSTEFNDSCLFLDELGEMPEKVNPGEVVYMLANGQGKQRMRADGKSKESASWRLLYLSTGEHDLGAESAKKGKQVKAGVLVRHADIPLDGLGINNLHGFKSAGELVDAMRHAAKRLYGTAGRAFLARLVDWRSSDEAGLQAALNGLIDQFISECIPGGADSQVISVARRFALVAVAGEWAIAWGVLPSPAGEGWDTAKACFAAHLAHRGHAGAHEDEAAVEMVKAFIRTHQYSRFKNANEGDRVINQCAGEISRDGDFLIYPHVFQDEICKGNDAKSIANILFCRGFLDRGNEKYRHTKKIRISEKTQYFYVISKSILEDGSISIVRAA
jgi:uncharacterized protein (DUF927 family)